MAEEALRVDPNDSLPPINSIDSDEHDSSFEVLEEESPLPGSNSLDPIEHCCDTDSDQLSGSCLCVDGAQWSESACLIETEQCSESPLTDRSIVLRHSTVVDCPKHSSRPKQQKMIDNLFRTAGDQQSATQDLLPVVSHRLCVSVIVCLVGLSFALALSNLRNSYHLSRLREEIALEKMQHTQELSRLSGMQSSHESRMEAVIAELERERHLLRELRLQSEQRLNREGQAGNSIVELQRERDKLIDELRAQSKRHTAQEEETNSLILDLQAERRRLMDAIEHNKNNKKCGTESDHKPSRTRNWFTKKLHKVKDSLKSLPNHVPGMRHLYNMFCEDRDWCDEF